MQRVSQCLHVTRVTYTQAACTTTLQHHVMRPDGGARQRGKDVSILMIIWGHPSDTQIAQSRSPRVKCILYIFTIIHNYVMCAVPKQSANSGHLLGALGPISKVHMYIIYMYIRTYIIASQCLTCTCILTCTYNVHVYIYMYMTCI